MTTVVETPRRTEPVRGHLVADTATMVGRGLLHVVRYPGLTIFVVGAPVVILLLFVFVFGGTLGAGLPGGADQGRGAYLAYVVPGILISTIAGGAASNVAITIAQDMTEGIVARFRTLAISRSAVLAGHVVATLAATTAGMVLALAVALALGYRPQAGVAGWFALVGVLVLVTLAVTWLGVALGMLSPDVETASNLPMPLLFLPFLGSGFVPTGSMPGWLQWFAEYQPFTAFIETVRALLSGTDPGWYLPATIIWSVAIGAAGWVWALRLYERRSLR